MSWCDFFHAKYDDHTGYVTSIDEARQLIDVFKQETLTDFIRLFQSKGFGKHGDINGKKHMVFWGDEDKFGRKYLYDGVPFVVLGREVHECHQGPQYNNLKKAGGDEEERNVKKRRFPGQMQCSKKAGCKARINLKQVAKFPKFKMVAEDDGKVTRDRVCKELRESLNNKETESEIRVYICLPQNGEHQNHSIGKDAGQRLKMDDRLVKFIGDKVNEGVKSVAEIQKNLNCYVKTLFTSGNLPPESSRRFYPTKADIQNKISLCQRRHNPTYHKSQETSKVSPLLGEVLTELSSNFPDDFCFVKNETADSNMGNPPLLVYQTSYQRRLLEIYGNEICILDSVFANCRFTLGLFLLYAKTNVNFSIIGCVVVTENTRELLQQGLRVLRKWNPQWNPNYFLCSKVNIQLEALEMEFSGCKVYVNDFCRDRDWMHWLTLAINNILNPQMAMRFLKKLSDSGTAVEYQSALKYLQNTYLWKINQRFRDWFTKTWLPEKHRWSRAFQEKIFTLKMSTGVNCNIKKIDGDCAASLLGYYERRSLNFLLEPLVTRVFPSHYQKYLDANKLDFLQAPSERCAPTFLPPLPECHYEQIMDTYHSVIAEAIPTCFGLGDGNFLVVTGYDSEGNTLGVKVSFGGEGQMPRCSCETWAKYSLPCAHFCIVFIQFPEHSWQSFPECYRNSVCFTVDNDAPQAPVFKKGTVGVAEECGSLNDCTDIDQLLMIVANECETATEEFCITDPVDVREECDKYLKGLRELVGNCGEMDTLVQLREGFMDIIRKIKLE